MMTMSRPSMIALLTLLACAVPLCAQDWQPSGPRGEVLRGVFPSPHQPDLVFVAPMNRNALLRSVDGGASFENAVGTTPGAVYAVDFHPTDPDTLWVSISNAILQSGDGGDTYTSLSPPPVPGRRPFRVLAAPVEGALYLGLGSTPPRLTHLYRSLDHGASWQLRYQSITSELDLVGLYLRSGELDTLYTVRRLPPAAGEVSGLHRSIDGGQTWEIVASPNPGITHYLLTGEVSWHPENPARIYTTASVSAGDFAVFSDDGGASFSLMNGPWGGPEHYRPQALPGGETVLLGAEDAWRQPALGETWQPWLEAPASYPPTEFPTLNSGDIVLHPAGTDRLFAFRDNAFLHTVDGGLSWSAGALGLQPLPVMGLRASPADPDRLLAAGETELYYSSDRGQSWQLTTLEMLSTGRFSATNPLQAVTWGMLGIPSITADGGASWTRLDVLGNVSGFAFSPGDDSRMMCVANPPGTPPGAYWSADGGASWQLADGAAAYQGRLYADPQTPGRVLMRSLNADGLLESLDHGETYLPIEDSLDVRDLAFQPDGPAMAAIVRQLDGQYAGRFAPDRNGPFTSSFPVPDDTWFLDFAPDNKLIASRPSAAYLSDDLGENWHLIISGDRPDFDQRAGVAILADGSVAFAAGTAGLLINEDGLGVSDPSHSDLTSRPRSFTLAAPYPNPFNATVTVSLYVPAGEVTVVEVIDLLGRRVATLHRGSLPPGRHPFIWQAENAASGRYLLRATGANGRSSVQPITLLR